MYVFAWVHINYSDSGCGIVGIIFKYGFAHNYYHLHTTFLMKRWSRDTFVPAEFTHMDVIDNKLQCWWKSLKWHLQLWFFFQFNANSPSFVRYFNVGTNIALHCIEYAIGLCPYCESHINFIAVASSDEQKQRLRLHVLEW